MKPINFLRLGVLTILPAFSQAGLLAQGLHLTSGINWVVSGSPFLVLNNSGLSNNGNFSADSSTVLFTGNMINFGSFIGGDRPVSFFNLTISKSSNDVQLNNNAVVRGMITMDSGNLQLNRYSIDLGYSGSIEGERNSSRITGINGGIIKITAILNSPHAVNPGNIGVEITSEENLGLTVITRGHLEQTNGDGQASIQRYFDFAPMRNSGLKATLRFYYLEGELVEQSKNGLTLYSSREGIGRWTLWGKDKINPTENWVVKSNIDELHRFTLAMTSRNEITMHGTSIAAQIFPNPAHNSFTLTLFSDKEKKESINLYDQSGHLLERKEVYCKEGMNTIFWDIAKYAGGVYYLGFENGTIRNIKLAKQ